MSTDKWTEHVSGSEIDRCGGSNQSPVQGETAGGTGAKSGRGGFFAVDAGVWPEVCALGINSALAYLVLASGTGKDMEHTRWSVNAIKNYTGISRVRAGEAVEALIGNGLVLRDGPWHSPCYRLLPAAEEPAVARSPAKRSQSGGEPIRSDLIWLPNTIVTGVAGETAPIVLIREMRDVMILRLLIELYGEQHMRVESGIRRQVLWQQHTRHKLGRTAGFTVWGFDTEPQLFVRWIGAAACHKQEGSDDPRDFFARLDAIRCAGLIEFILHLVEGEDAEAEILHPYGTGQSDSLEDQVGSAASDAAYALLTEISQDWANKYHVAPVRQHIANVQMIGIARLRYRARTRAAAAWQADLLSQADKYLPVYRGILSKRVEL